MRQSIAKIPRAHAVEILLHTDLATAQRQVAWTFGVLEWTGAGVLLRAQAESLDWVALELSRLPFDFSVRSPSTLRRVLARAGDRLGKLARAGN